MQYKPLAALHLGKVSGTGWKENIWNGKDAISLELNIYAELSGYEIDNIPDLRDRLVY